MKLLKPSNRQLVLTKREAILFDALVKMGAAIAESNWHRVNQSWQRAMRQFPEGKGR